MHLYSDGQVVLAQHEEHRRYIICKMEDEYSKNELKINNEIKDL